MAPTLDDGDFVVALGARWAGRPRRGDIVLAEHAELGLIVKRVLYIDATGDVSLGDDNPWSRESAQLGIFERGALRGRVVLRVGRASGGLSRIPRGAAGSSSASPLPPL